MSDDERILAAYRKMLALGHNTSLIALDEKRTRFLSLAIVDAEHLEVYLRRNNLSPAEARELARNLTRIPSMVEEVVGKVNGG